MYEIHYLENSRAHRVLWLLEETGVPYQVVRYAREPVTLKAPSDLAVIHPLGKSPVLRDGKITLAESGAILAYLLDRHDEGGLACKSGTPTRPDYLYWFHFAEGSATLPLSILHNLGLLQPRPDTAISNAMQNLRGILAFIESTLRTREHFVDDVFSAADIQMSYPLQAASRRGYLGDFPVISTYLDRVSARPAYMRAQTAGENRI